MSKLTGSRKALQFTESVIREMTRLNEQHGGVNLSQGFPGLPGAGRRQGRRLRGHQRRRQPVRGHLGRPAAARSDRAVLHPPLRRRGGGRHAGHRLLRRDRSDDVHDDGDHRPGRRSHRLRAVLRELRARRDPVRRHAALRHAARARLELRPRRARGRLQREDEGDHHQHAEQPDGQGLYRARSSRRLPSSVRSGTRSRSRTRSTNTSSTTGDGTSRLPRSPAWRSAP